MQGLVAVPVEVGPQGLAGQVPSVQDQSSGALRASWDAPQRSAWWATSRLTAAVKSSNSGVLTRAVSRSSSACSRRSRSLIGLLRQSVGGAGVAVLGDDVVAAALIDRLLHHCHIVNVRGDSYRMRAHQELWRSMQRPGGDASPARGTEA